MWETNYISVGWRTNTDGWNRSVIKFNFSAEKITQSIIYEFLFFFFVINVLSFKPKMKTKVLFLLTTSVSVSGFLPGSSHLLRILQKILWREASELCMLEFYIYFLSCCKWWYFILLIVWILYLYPYLLILINSTLHEV